MLSLGISEDFFDAGVALCDGPKVLFASNEERYTRRKNEGGFPYRALESLFASTGVEPSDIDAIYVAGHMTPPFPVRAFPRLHEWMFEAHRDPRPTAFKRLMDMAAFMTPVSHTSPTSPIRKLILPLLSPVTRRRLPHVLRAKPIRFVEHHTAHAAAAWRLSGFEETLCITADGMGDGLSLTVSHCAPACGIHRLWAVESRQSFGLFFEALTEAFGFTPCRDEGKLSGLAAAGDPARVREKSPFILEQGRLCYCGPHGRHGVAWVREALLAQYAREDVAAWAQDLLERHLVEVARWWLRETGLTRLAVAGGVFANVGLNQHLHELNEVEAFFVCPNMGDGGLSLGAIAAEAATPPEPAADVFWGEAFSSAGIQAALDAAQLRYTREPDIEDRVAALLVQGHMVARHHGKMEWGPRALGNRSILVRATEPAIVDRLNQHLKRSKFMPFAPALLDEEADRYLLNFAAARRAAEFMTVCFNCTDAMKREHPAVVHIDGTARAQLVTCEANPALHKILSGLKQRTGSSVVLNTSFNLHEEPIVRTPDETVAAFLRGELDYLAIGEFLVFNPRADVGNR